MFDLDLKKFRDARPSRAQIAHDEIPVQPLFGFQLPAEEAIVRIADDILQKVLLLNFDELHLEIRLLDEGRIVDRTLFLAFFHLEHYYARRTSFTCGYRNRNERL